VLEVVMVRVLVVHVVVRLGCCASMGVAKLVVGAELIALRSYLARIRGVKP
jgi:hypothetical protein